MSDNIVVSVCVITYKHSRYIRDCLEGIFNQRTTFEFEVIVGNDSSPDETARILNSYKDSVKRSYTPINRPSNIGGKRNFVDVVARAKGEYIAICDGDDYWIDPLKLQKQYDALQRHPNVDLCFHPAKVIGNEKFHSVRNNLSAVEMIYSLNQVIEGGGAFMPTASLLIRKSSICPFPSWFVDKAPAGDTFIQVLGSIRGGALFLPDVMSAYTRFSVGSATASNLQHFSFEKIKTQAKNYRYCYLKLAERLDHNSGIICRAAMSKLLFDLSVKALDASNPN
ncbi:glycosyltransferase [Oleiphilus sp. HI0066]|uniref:glycosyltransferase family 2 protein n=1 Tax=Oleiphilus sp. HI0066 TaxID=1822242 RepID=UPI0007C2D7B7|nr:glycosyltransferase [Oleiphilus sp. HI0066]KZY63321.1 hypothetical protein A3738_12030 [Oleiphilus sp. HI0066]